MRPHASMMTDTREDAALLVAAKASAIDAVGELYRRHGDAVYGLAYRVLGSREEADDVLQDVFVGLPRRSTGSRRAPPASARPAVAVPGPASVSASMAEPVPVAPPARESTIRGTVRTAGSLEPIPSATVELAELQRAVLAMLVAGERQLTVFDLDYALYLDRLARSESILLEDAAVGVSGAVGVFTGTAITRLPVRLMVR